MKNKFKKGIILGGLLTGVAILGMVISKNGKEITEDLKEDFKSLVEDLKNRLLKLHDVTKEDFEKLIAILVEDYTKKKEISNDTKEALITALKTKWDEMEKEYLKEQSLSN